jgi:hypothetical protein
MCFDAKLNLEKDKCNAWVINLFLDNKIFKICAHLSCPDVHPSYPEVKPNNRCRTRLYTVKKAAFFCPYPVVHTLPVA